MTSVLSHKVSHKGLWMALFCLSLFLGGCCPWGQSFGPRAPRMIVRSTTIVDYVEEGKENCPCRVKCKCGKDKEEDLGAQTPGRGALLPEFFDPYQPLLQAYRATRGDVLEISVFGDTDTLINEAIIAPDGMLYYMFLEGIKAEDKTLDELKAELEGKLGTYFVNPEVSVIPKKIASHYYMVLGKVKRPGVFPVTTAITLQQAIGDAGGIALGGYAGTTINIANLRNSFLVRGGEKLDIDFERLVYTDGSDQNIYIRPGDYIYIASSLVDQIYLVGEVSGQKPIQYKDGLTLMQVLSGVAGTTEGWKTSAWVSNVLIVRGSLKCPKAYGVNVLKIVDGSARDVYLLPGDIVYVQKKPFRFGRELVHLAIDTFVRAFAAEAGVYYMDKWLDRPAS